MSSTITPPTSASHFAPSAGSAARSQETSDDSPPEPPADAAEAARLYDAGDFAGAAAVYSRLLDEASPGVGSAALHYNLGNAHFRSGRVGRAILEWERSLLLSPGDEDARANLDLARDLLARRLDEAAGGNADSEDGSPGSVAALFRESDGGAGGWLLRIPAGRFAVVSGAAALGAGALASLLLLGVGRRRPIAWGMAGLSAVLVVALGLLVARQSLPPRAVVVTPAAALRSGPSTTFPQLAALPDGFTVEIRGEGQGDAWLRVSAAGIVGWASPEDVRPISFAAAPEPR